MRSLAARYPWRIDVPLLLVGSLVLLWLGLTRPAMEVRACFFWGDEYSILSNILSLHHQGKEPAAAALAACSVGYPVGKILALLYLWLVPFSARWRRRFVRVLRLMGRWSMMDVLAVTAIVLASRVIGPLDASPRQGVYYYCGAIFSLAVATVLMDWLASRIERRPGSGPRRKRA